jgi:hypothetical protein
MIVLPRRDGLEAGMSDDDVTLEMSMPLDSDGFLRRECPTCEREFKWFSTPEEEGTAAPVTESRRSPPLSRARNAAS